MVQSSGRWRRLRFGGNVTPGKKTYSRLAGYVFQRVQITTGKNYDRKKRYSRVAWPAVFSGGFKLQPEKITTGKIKKVQLSGRWRWLRFGGNVTTRKKRTVVWPAMFFRTFKLQPKKLNWKKKVQSSGRQLKTGKNYIGKKGTVVWLSVGGHHTKHNTHHRHNNQQDVW